MESIYQDIDEGILKDTNEIIQKMENCLDSGANIDLLFPQKDSYSDHRKCFGTILHYSIIKGYDEIVNYALSKRANIACKMTSTYSQMKYENALEVAAQESHRNPNGRSIFEMLKQHSLNIYSLYGLTPLHIDCAIDMDFWSDESVQKLQTAEVNVIVSVESPLWPGMTPILIAAKTDNEELVKCLLDAGSDPFVWDPQGNTPLHYLFNEASYDERLFLNDASNSFGSFNGESHFHMACRKGRRAINIVKRYLDQGISPDLPIQSNGYKNNFDAGKVGLHLAAEVECWKLIRLLIEYGAQVNSKDSYGKTPIQYVFDNCDSARSIYCICLFIEAGSDVNRDDLDGEFFELLSERISYLIFFLKCVTRLITLNESLVPVKLKGFYLEVFGLFGSLMKDSYTADCLKELKAFSDPGLRQILDDTIVVKSDFKERFQWLNFKSFPNYRSMLELKTKKNMLEYKKKKRIMPRAIFQIQSLAKSICQLPLLCADNILWNLNSRELDEFVTKSTSALCHQATDGNRTLILM